MEVQIEMQNNDAEFALEVVEEATPSVECLCNSLTCK
jgi:hypothetical protein